MGFTYNFGDGRWYADDIVDLNDNTVNNFMQYGQPFSPYESGFNHTVANDHYTNTPTVVISQESVMNNGYGRGVSARDFPVVNNLLGSEVRASGDTALSDGSYSFDDLESLGIVSASDRTIRGHLYADDVTIRGVPPVNDSGNIPAYDAAYVHGTIGFALMGDTTFEVENGRIVSVNARIGALDDNFDFTSSTIPGNLNGLVQLLMGPDYVPNGARLNIEYRGDGRFEVIGVDNNHCFKADTPIQMWPLDPSIKPRTDGTYDEQLVLSKVWEKPISDIRVGDLVISYDDKGRIKPGPVTRTMTNTATHLLDFWNTGVTPGHAYYCADGKFKDQHVPLMDILRTDGAIMRADGTMIRAATNCKVGSMGDMMIHASATLQKPDGTWTDPKPGKVRFGTRIILPDGTHMSFMEMAANEGWKLTDDGYMVGTMKGEDGEFQDQKFHFPYSHGEELPKPEDYILARSQVTLEDIYLANEWEQIGTRMPAPDSLAGFNPNGPIKRTKPKPNIPPAFADRPDAPTANNRAQRAAHASVSPSAPGTYGNVAQD